MQQGITFDAAGPDAEGPIRDRPFPLDLVPRLIPAAEWTAIKRGLAQRIRALNQFIDDVYHGREIVHEGLVPWELIVSRSGFARAAHGIRPPGGVYCHVSGCDLVRDRDGSWKVLEDNVRTPSGISYVLENRLVMLRAFPGLAQAHARIWEMPISYSGRTYSEGKKITWKDGVAALFHIVRYNLLVPGNSNGWRSLEK